MPIQYGEDADSARKCGRYWHSALTIGIAFSGDADADVHVDAEDLQAAGQPLHVLDQLGVALLGRDLLGLPVGERVRARAHQAQAAAVGGGAHLGERAREVGLRLGDRRADAGDDLDGRLEQLVLGLGVLLGAVGPDLREDLDAPAVSSRVSRSTSCSSHSTPRLARSEDWKGICTSEV